MLIPEHAVNVLCRLCQSLCSVKDGNTEFSKSGWVLYDVFQRAILNRIKKDQICLNHSSNVGVSTFWRVKTLYVFYSSLSTWISLCFRARVLRAAGCILAASMGPFGSGQNHASRFPCFQRWYEEILREKVIWL